MPKLELHARNPWMFTVEVLDTPQGPKAYLVDAKSSLLETDDPGEKMMQIAKILEDSVVGLRANATAMKA